MSELTDISSHPLEDIECAQHRLLWHERLLKKAQRKAWSLWMKVLLGLISATGTLAGLWTLIIHGGR